MKRILFVSPTAALGGAERVMQTIAEYLLIDGWEVTFYVMSRGDKEGWEELKKHPDFNFIVKDYNSEKTGLPALLYNIVSLNKKYDYKYIFSSHSHINATLSTLKKIKLLPNCFLIGRESTVVFDRYQGVSRMAFKLIYTCFYGAHDLLVCQTEEMKKSLTDALNNKLAKKIEVIPNPVSLKRIDKSLHIDEEIIKFDKKIKNIVACGRLASVKNFTLLIKAFAKVVVHNTNVHLYIVGDGIERETLQQLCEKLDLTDHITFTGKQPNPSKWFQIADLGVISSIKEGFPNVLLEMMASGTKAIITTPCTGDLDKLPKVKVSKDLTVEGLSSLMEEVLLSNIDNSYEYRCYIEKFRSVDSFWANVEINI